MPTYNLYATNGDDCRYQILNDALNFAFYSRLARVRDLKQLSTVQLITQSNGGYCIFTMTRSLWQLPLIKVMIGGHLVFISVIFFLCFCVRSEQWKSLQLSINNLNTNRCSFGKGWQETLTFFLTILQGLKRGRGK